MGDPIHCYFLYVSRKSVKELFQFILYITSIFCMSSKFKNIVVSEANYNVLKNLGSTGESFNDVLTEVLNKVSKVSFVGESNAG